MQRSSVFNRLSTYTADGVTASYTYDGDNLRQSKTVNGSTVNHLLDGANVVADIYPDSTNIYVYGNGVELFKTGGQTSRYTKSYRGDVTAVTTGDTKTEYFYDAFGNKQTDTDTSTNPFEYCGEYFDDETGLIYLRNRYYDPTNGRFVTEDPVRDGENWYVYAGNNPVMFVDLDGLRSVIYCANIKKMIEQGKIRQEYYSSRYGTETLLIVVSSSDEFSEKWNEQARIANSQNEEFDAIEIIAHGSASGKVGKNSNGEAFATGYIYFTENKDNRLFARNNSNMKSGDVSVESLSDVSANQVSVNCCNSANPDLYNVVYAFMGKIKYRYISGWDGGTKWDDEKLDHVRGDGEIVDNLLLGRYYYVNKYQHTWWKYVDKNADGSPARSRTGKRAFIK